MFNKAQHVLKTAYANHKFLLQIWYVIKVRFMYFENLVQKENTK